MNEKKKKEKRKILVISLIQIFLLIIMPISYGNNIGQSIQKEDFSIDKIFNGFSKEQNALSNFLKISDKGMVSAQNTEETEGKWCCVEENEGGGGMICQNVSIGDSHCDRYIPSNCSNVPNCSMGTCIYNGGLSCSGNTAKWKCIEDGGIWKKGKILEQPECSKGCCVLGDDTEYITEKKCEQRVDELSDIAQKDFRGDWSQSKCNSYFTTLEKGACIYPGSSKQCEVTSNNLCLDSGGEFHKGELCTHENLNTNCEPTEQTTCSQVSGDYNIYFIDSCGNKANIYDSNKVDNQNYWNDIQKPDCTSEPGSETCGVCDYPESKCMELRDDEKVDYGTKICRDLTCKNAYDTGGIEKDRKHGESWCVYESRVGKGRDLPGSQHWLLRCTNGKVEWDESNGEARNKICAEENRKVNGENYSTAQYRVNMWMTCFNAGDNEKKCDNLRDCYMVDVDVWDGFEFSLCAPKYPPGNTEMCNKINNDDLQCKYIKYRDTQWEGYDNYKHSKECERSTLSDEMNELCYSLGDCGGCINTEGEYMGRYDSYVTISDNHKNKIKNFADTSNWNKKDIKNNKPEYVGSIVDEDQDEENGNNGLPDIYDESPWIKYPYSETGMFWRNWDDIFSGEGMIFGSDILIVQIIEGIVNLIFQILEGLFESILYLLGLHGDIIEYPKNFKCHSWNPPLGGDNCEKCQEDIFPCTEYKCNSLGQSCKFVDTGDANTQNPICVDYYSDDITPPKINFTGTNPSYNYQDIEGENFNGVKITEKINSNQEVEFKINTENHSACGYKYNREPSMDFSENLLNSNLFIDTSGYSKNHTFTEFLSLSSQEEYSEYLDINEMEDETIGNLELFVRCQDVNGNKNPTLYVIEMNISSKDNTAPSLNKFHPKSDTYLKYGKEKTNFSIKLNERISGCKYSYSSGISYSNMNNDIGCTQSTTCYGQWESMTESTNKIYVRCNDTAGNINTDDYEYILHKTPSPLNITDIYLKDEENQEYRQETSEPTDIILGKNEKLKLNLETTGGVNSGKSNCKWSFSETPQTMVSSGYMKETNSTAHAQPGINLGESIYNITVECYDKPGVHNEDSKTILFNLSRDSTPPEIINMSFNQEEGKLIIKTNEPAKCAYSEKDEYFDFSEGSSFSNDFVMEQKTGWDPSWAGYRIECIDEYDNLGYSTYLGDSTKSPEITRTYKSGGELKINTDIDAKCYYSIDSCEEVTDENSMTGANFQKTHSTTWNSGNTYYIKCENRWGERNSECTIVNLASLG